MPACIFKMPLIHAYVLMCISSVLNCHYELFKYKKLEIIMEVMVKPNS